MTLSAWIATVVGFLRRRRVAAAGGALLVILVAVWWSEWRQGARTQPAIDWGPSPPSHEVAALSSASQQPSSGLPTAKDDELCGYGPVPVVDGIPQVPPEIERAAQSALGSLAADLSARSADRERAMGLYLQTIAAGAAWSRTHPNCATDDGACEFDANRAAWDATADSRRVLVRLATSTSDPDAYALAIYSCRPWPGVSSIGDCALLRNGQWARIEPDNAVPWLFVAGEAQQRGDRNAFETALNRASKARYSDPHLDQISKLLASDALAAQSPPIQMQLAISLLGIQAALPLPDFHALAQYCSGAAQTDPNGIQTCSDLASTLVEHGRTEVEVMVGGRIAEQIGSTNPRLSTLRDEADAIRWQWGQWLKSMRETDHRSLTCNSLQALRRNAAVRAQLGESGRLYQQLAVSGLTASQAAERWRADMRQFQQQSHGPQPKSSR
jgi:hypothetical protein